MSNETNSADIRSDTARECEKIANEVCRVHYKISRTCSDANLASQRIAAAMAASEIARRIAALYR